MSKPTSRDRLIQTRVDAEVADKIAHAAEREGLSVAAYVRRLLIQKSERLSLGRPAP